MGPDTPFRGTTTTKSSKRGGVQYRGMNQPRKNNNGNSNSNNDNNNYDNRYCA